MHVSSDRHQCATSQSRAASFLQRRARPVLACRCERGSVDATPMGLGGHRCRRAGRPAGHIVISLSLGAGPPDSIGQATVPSRRPPPRALLADRGGPPARPCWWVGPPFRSTIQHRSVPPLRRARPPATICALTFCASIGRACVCVCVGQFSIGFRDDVPMTTMREILICTFRRTCRGDMECGGRWHVGTHEGHSVSIDGSYPQQ